jgi:hypothetical protein
LVWVRGIGGCTIRLNWEVNSIPVAVDIARESWNLCSASANE